MPLAILGCLIEMSADEYGRLDLLQLRSEIEVMRRVVHRIRSENQQRIDLARVHVGAKLGKRLQLIHRIGFDRLRVINRRSNVPERRVYGMSKGMHFRRLELSGNDDRFATILLEVAGYGIEPLFHCWRKRTAATQAQF